MTRLVRRPITQRDANRFVGEHHRHNVPVRGDLFRTSIVDDTGSVRGVGIAARPKSRVLDDGTAVEIVRVCTDGAENGCSALYGALCRAAKALGWQRAYTYTQAGESGHSVKAAGFVFDAFVPEHEGWSRPSRPRQPDLWGNEAAPRGAKTRWVRDL